MKIEMVWPLNSLLLPRYCVARSWCGLPFFGRLNVHCFCCVLADEGNETMFSFQSGRRVGIKKLPSQSVRGFFDRLENGVMRPPQALWWVLNLDFG